MAEVVDPLSTLFTSSDGGDDGVPSSEGEAGALVDDFPLDFSAIWKAALTATFRASNTASIV